MKPVLIAAALFAISSSALADVNTCDGGRKTHDFSHPGGRTSFDIECKSTDNCFQRCLTGLISDAFLVEQLSTSAACVEGVTWGRELSSIWVTEGCEAVFEVYKH